MVSEDGGDVNFGAWSQDKMDRKRVANFLTKYLDGSSHVKVLNINSPWGSGKTFFLDNWRSQLSENRACVYFNAWESDFSGDAFVSLVASIREQLKDLSGAAAADSSIRKFTKSASKAIVAASPVLLKGVIKKFTGMDFGAVSDTVDVADLADAAEKAVESMIENNQETLNIVSEFKVVLKELLMWAAQAKSSGAEIKPVYIFIDELDRCRPTFAIELLERVKHFFDVEGCVFVIATDTAQLCHSIKAVYGEGFSSEKYLKRFFDTEFSLDNADVGVWVQAMTPDFSHVELINMCHALNPADSRSYYGSNQPVAPGSLAVLAGELNLNKEQVILLALAQTFGSKLRELDKIFKHIYAISRNVSGSKFDLFWAAYLVFLKDEAADLYECALRGSASEVSKKINARFQAKELYMVTSSVTVHELFFDYLSLYRIPQHEVRKRLRDFNQGGSAYLEVITTEFTNSYQELCAYPNLVDLAHKID